MGATSDIVCKLPAGVGTITVKAVTCLLGWCKSGCLSCTQPAQDGLTGCTGFSPAVAAPCEEVVSPHGMEAKLEVEVEADSCLTHLNSLRAGKGLPAMTLKTGSMSCAVTSASSDGPNLNWHNSFGKCGENGQCEAAGQATCEKAMDSYYSEGPGGGHYDIIMSTRFKSMAYGKCSCSKYNVFWTHNFYTTTGESEAALV